MRSRLVYLDFIAFVPLVVFLSTLKLHTAEYPARWAYAYLYAFAPALVFSIIAMSMFRRCDKLWLGTNLWFSLLGVFSFFRAWGPLEVLARMFQESGGFVITAVLGVLSTMAAPGSFVGAPHGSTGAAVRYSWFLVAISAATALLSYLSVGNRLWSITVPVAVFVLSNVALRHRLKNAKNAA